MNLGFTGSREGFTAAQHREFVRLIEELKPTRFDQGCCTGSDEQATILVRTYFPTCFITGRPGKSAKGGDNEFLSQRALALCDQVMETKTHFARNRDIVNSSDVVIGTPCFCPIEKTSSGGTAYTLNQAINKGKKVYIICPQGKVTEI